MNAHRDEDALASRFKRRKRRRGRGAAPEGGCHRGGRHQSFATATAPVLCVKAEQGPPRGLGHGLSQKAAPRRCGGVPGDNGGSRRAPRGCPPSVGRGRAPGHQRGPAPSAPSSAAVVPLPPGHGAAVKADAVGKRVEMGHVRALDVVEDAREER